MAPPNPHTTDDLEAKALHHAAGATPAETAVSDLVGRAGGDRPSLEEARNRVARHMLGNVSDVQSGAALQLLNTALVELGWVDPYQWTQRLGNRLRKP